MLVLFEMGDVRYFLQLCIFFRFVPFGDANHDEYKYLSYLVSVHYLSLEEVITTTDLQNETTLVTQWFFNVTCKSVSIFSREGTGYSFPSDQTPSSMADDDSENDASTILSPRIIFVRLGKDKSKDAIEDEIFKYVNKVLEESNDNGDVSEKAKNCIITLPAMPDLATGRILQVAVGPEFVGLLFDNGRVCRFKCVTKNLDSSKKLWSSQRNQDEPSFQIQSDEAYARQLQNEILNNGATTSALPGRSPALESSAISSSPINILSRTSRCFARTGFGNGLVGNRTAQRYVPSSIPGASNSSSAPGTRESQTTENVLDKPSGTSSSVEDNGSRGSQANPSVQTRSSVIKSVGSKDGSSSSDTASPSKTSTAEASAEQGKPDSHQSKDQGSSNNSQENSAENRPGNGSSVSSSQSSNSRRSVSSPTLLQRTVFTTNFPVMRQFSAPFIFPAGSMSFPLYSNSTTGQIFGSRGSLRLEPRVVRAQLAEAGAFPRGSTTTSSAQRCDDRSSNVTKCASCCSDADFCYPEIGDVEWLEVENGREVIFSHISAMHSEFLLVEKGTGILYHWAYESDIACGIAMEISSSQDPTYLPLAKPHPLGEAIGLDNEEVCLLASSNVRCSLLTTSGKICTFYDKLLRESSCGDPPALIQELSHPAMSFSELKGENILSISCSEFFTSVMTESGKVFWWGLLPAEERQNFKQKLSKATNEASQIGVNEKVQLRQHFPGFPGALVYKCCEIRGPLVGRLICHESPEGTSTTVTKIRVEPLNGNIETGSKPVSEPVASQQSTTESSAANTPRSRTVEEELISTHKDVARSSSPHTSVRRKAQSSNKPANGSEIWEVKDVVFLESENKLLGTVAAIDGPHVIVSVANVMSPSEPSLRVFKVSELESVPSEGERSEGTTGSQQMPTSSLYRGCVQHVPKCIVSSSSKMGNKELLAGLKPVAMATTSGGISLLAQRLSDRRAFFLGPAMEQAIDSSKVYTCGTDVNVSNNNDDGSCTVEAESISSQEAALTPTSLVQSVTQEKPVTGQKRRRADDDDDDHVSNTSQNMTTSAGSDGLLPCNIHTSTHRYPLLHSTSDCDVVILTDVNGCLYPRPYGTKLSDPEVGEIPPVQSFGLGTRLGQAPDSSSPPERVLMVFIAFQEQGLLQAVQSGMVQKIKQALNGLKQLNSSKDIGKGSKGIVKGSKKMGIADSLGQIQQETTGDVVVISNRVLRILHQHSSSNQNVLHICCSNPCYGEKGQQVDVAGFFQDAGSSSDDTSDSTINISFDVAGLHLLLNDSIFAKEFVPMLKERDARGYTPFMTAIQCRNFKAATYILDFVENNKGNTTPKLQCSMEDMVYPEGFNGMMPLHALAIACTENLPPSGLGKSLTVTNLPSSYTPRILLKLFQARYPSAYRATIPPVTMEGRKCYRTKTPKQRLLEKPKKEKVKKTHKKLADAKRGNHLTPTTSSINYNPWSRRYVGESARIPIVSSRRESLTGMVTFSDPKELRQALVEMDHHMVSSEMTAPEGGLASLVQHVLHVKLTEVENEETEKMEMEVGVRGGVYNVSNIEGMAKIIPKAQTSDGTSMQAQMVDAEDKLICQLFSRLLSHLEIVTARNKEGETPLAFLVNNSRWIKLTANQKLRLTKYGNVLFGQEATFPGRREVTSQPQAAESPEDDQLMAEINITGMADPAMLESNLLAQLDDISSSFRSIVDTLTALERRCSTVPGAVEDKAKTVANETSTGESAGPALENPTANPNLISCSSNVAGVLDDLFSDSLPVLIQLTQSWPSVASTVLGYFPMDSPDVDMTPESRGSSKAAHKSSSHSGSMESCALDSFVFELLSYSDEAVLVSFVETIVSEMNKHSEHLTLEAVQRASELCEASSARDVAMIVGVKFLRSVIRQLAVHLSRSGLSYVDLRTRLGSGPSASNVRNSQGDNLEFKRKVRMILRSFSWLAVHELVQAAEASVLPVREGVAKPQPRSTGSSISNSISNSNGGLYSARFRCRPGIRVSGPHDTAGRTQDPLLRTAQRIQHNKPAQITSSCQGIRLANIADGPSAAPNKKPVPRSHPFRSSPFELTRSVNKRSSLLDSDSDSDEEPDRVGPLGGDPDSDMELDEPEPSSVSLATGITHDHPYAWALDGRVAGSNEGNGMHGSIHIPQLAASVISPPSIHTGNCYLTRMFSRLVKETLDLMVSLSQDAGSTQPGAGSELAILPTLSIGQEECQSIQNSMMSVLEKSWVWLAGVLDVVEGQLRLGKHFDTKRYLTSLQRPEDTELAMLTRTVSTIPGASPEEYLMFLLRAHSNEHKDSLPVVDMLCYEHAVYVLDAFIYSMTHWPRSGKVLDRSVSISSHDGDDSGLSSSQPSQNEEGLEARPSPNTAESKRRRRHSHDREKITKFFGMDVMHADKEKFLSSLQDTVQQKFPKVPKASWEVFTHNVTVSRQKSCDDTNLTSQRENEEDSNLPTTFSAMDSHTYTFPLVLSWSPDQVMARWKISVDLFSRLFLADGPGAERDSFLAARAGVAGRLARFRRAASYLRDSITNEAQQLGPYGSMGGRVGTTLSLSIKRQRILESTLRILGEMSAFHYSNLRVKFEGEEGSGPGVNRGFFAAMANALKTDQKLPEDTTTLLHEPGKLPEQSGFYAPKPFACSEKSVPEENLTKTRRLKMFTAIGRFIGLSLWFSNTVPLNFSRHVVKFLLEREVTWEDLAFFNADLFEGLSRMILDGTHPLMTSERFQAIYCCHFETSVGGTTEELVPGGSQIPVTPDNICKYVRLYATKVMVGCVENELRAMRSGLHDVIPSELLSSLTPEDFQLLVSGGTTDVDINRLRSVITFSNSNGCSTDILDRFKRWFWSIVQKMTPLQRQQLLYFCTGSAVLPALSDRRDPEQDLSITVEVISGNTKALPMATTCGQRMSIPLYSSKKILKRKLLQAIQCQSYGLG